LTDTIRIITAAAAVLLYLGWLFLYFLRIDPFIRVLMGRLLSVDIAAARDSGGTIGWRVTGASGWRALCIELLQYLFLLPAAVVPAAAAIVLFVRWAG
jgi:hypothetical protein